MPSLADIAKLDTKDIDFGALVGRLKPRAGGKEPKRGGTVVGLDIQPGYIAAVEADVNGVVSVRRSVGMPLPADVVRDGEVSDAGLLADAIRELFATSSIGRRVRVGLANQRTVVRIMDLPPIEDRRELQAAVQFQAQDQIPMPLSAAVLDFHMLGIVDTPAGPRQRVVVAAAQSDLVARLVEAVQRAGLKPAGVDLSAFAMIRALHRTPSAAAAQPPSATHSTDGGEPAAVLPSESRTLYLNVGGITNVAIAEGVTCRFTRTVAGGLESMAAQLAERRSIPLAEARAALAAADLAAQQAPPAPAPAEGDGAPAQPAAPQTEVMQDGLQGDAGAILRAGVREIAGEVRNSLDFHRAQEGGGEVSDVVLSGTALEMDGFQRALENELGFSVRTRTVALSAEAHSEVPPQRLTIAAGLAVEEVAP